MPTPPRDLGEGFPRPPLESLQDTEFATATFAMG